MAVSRGITFEDKKKKERQVESEKGGDKWC